MRKAARIERMMTLITAITLASTNLKRTSNNKKRKSLIKKNQLKLSCKTAKIIQFLFFPRSTRDIKGEDSSCHHKKNNE